MTLLQTNGPARRQPDTPHSDFLCS